MLFSYPVTLAKRTFKATVKKSDDSEYLWLSPALNGKDSIVLNFYIFAVKFQ